GLSSIGTKLLTRVEELRDLTPSLSIRHSGEGPTASARTRAPWLAGVEPESIITTGGYGSGCAGHGASIARSRAAYPSPACGGGGGAGGRARPRRAFQARSRLLHRGRRGGMVPR